LNERADRLANEGINFPKDKEIMEYNLEPFAQIIYQEKDEGQFEEVFMSIKEYMWRTRNKALIQEITQSNSHSICWRSALTTP
jgi:hypothetical protein